VHRLCRPWHRRLWCYLWILYGHLIVRPLHILCWNSRKPTRRVWAWWEKTSVAWVRRSGKNLLGFRAWILLSGVRNKEVSKLKLAFNRLSPRTQKALVGFVARKLANRQDAYAKKILDEWLNGPCTIKKSAAATALEVHESAEKNCVRGMPLDREPSTSPLRDLACSNLVQSPL
jgi:hypothetical protein